MQGIPDRWRWECAYAHDRARVSQVTQQMRCDESVSSPVIPLYQIHIYRLVVRRLQTRRAECAAVRHIEHFSFEESTPVHRPVAILPSATSKDDRFLRYPLQPDGCKRILMALIIRLEDQPRQSAELPWAVADGDVRREPSRPSATAKVGCRQPSHRVALHRVVIMHLYRSRIKPRMMLRHDLRRKK